MIDIIGMGEEGLAGLSHEALRRLQEAEVVVASERLLDLVPESAAIRHVWPSPLSEAAAFLQSLGDAPIAALVSGDPLWFSLGSLLAREIPSERCRIHPHVSSFQLAAARLGWSMSEIACETIHGRPVTNVSPLLGEGQRLLLFTTNGRAPHAVAFYLVQAGYGATRMTVLSRLGGDKESRHEALASEWSESVDDLHVLALEVRASRPTLAISRAPGRAPGLPDDAFVHDGQLTKQHVRALTLARLRPMPGSLLWDLGCGCGSVSIEWMRGAHGARAIGIDRSSPRLGKARLNADMLGAKAISLIEGDVLQALQWEESPDAAFIGGGVSEQLIDGVWNRLKRSGRLVANAVTWKSQKLLHEACKRYGGALVRVSVETPGSLGGQDAWMPAITVVQWSVERFPES